MENKNIKFKNTNLKATFLFLFLFLIAITSMAGDSLTMDEVAHLPAGYSYLTQKDMRLNPEHPPLLKDLSALPLLLLPNIKFPSDIKAWTQEVNGQWGFGFNFMYEQQNPADLMIFLGRLPMILILILLGYYVFKWARELWGERAGLIALFLFTFSPAFIAHGRLVTTDVGAAAAFLIATYYFVHALQAPNFPNIILAGLTFGLAQLTKFSLILLIPLFGFLVIIWWFANQGGFWLALRTVFLIFGISALLIWGVYYFHTFNYPPQKQAQDAQILLASFFWQPAKDIVSSMADNTLLRPYAQYLLGLFMVLERATHGHTTYFMGQIGAQGWPHYFPVVYLIKEPLPFHILTILALFLGLAFLIKNFNFNNLRSWLRNHLPETAMILLIIIYWITSLRSPLNIGVRHLLPVFPFTMLLISRQINIALAKNRFWALLVLVLFLWQAISVISIYPHFIAYFNELVGGPKGGIEYTVNSNLDWGQDLKRLAKWVNKNNIDIIYIDYFGGGKSEYYLGEKFRPWWGTRSPSELPKESYLAVSATFLKGGQGKPIAGFTQPTGYYEWLKQYQPIATIGYSIYVYHIK